MKEVVYVKEPRYLQIEDSVNKAAARGVNGMVRSDFDYLISELKRSKSIMDEQEEILAKLTERLDPVLKVARAALWWRAAKLFESDDTSHLLIEAETNLLEVTEQDLKLDEP